LQAWKAFKEMNTKFGLNIPEGRSESVEGMLKRGKLTWIEVKLLAALIESMVDKPSAVLAVSDIVSTFDDAGVATGDIFKTLWTEALKVRRK